MFDRVALINLDKRKDRLGAFKAKITQYPSLHGFVRYRAIHGDTVSVPKAFISGGGAWGCRQSHLRVLEDALQDGVNTLLVLEDDVRFVPGFDTKLAALMKIVPDDWEGLMLGGQDVGPPAPTNIEGLVRSSNTQRTHAYVVRGVEPMRDLYRLWSWCDRHIDHWFGQWQQRHQVYQPTPFLCGQDETVSDISGRSDIVRYWDQGQSAAKDQPITLLISDRAIAETLRNFGFHFGYDRDKISGRDKGLENLEMSGWPAEKLTSWATLIVGEAMERGDVPGMWYTPLPSPIESFTSRLGRPVNCVEARSVEEAVIAIPQLLPAWKASKVIWCWRGVGAENLEGLKFHGWHRGHWIDEITGIDQGIRQVVEQNKYGSLKNLARQLVREAGTVRYGKVLIAHPALNMDRVREELNGYEIHELIGENVAEVIDDSKAFIDKSLEMYTNVVAKGDSK